MARKIRVYRDGAIRVLNAGISFKEYQAKFPHAVRVTRKTPSERQLHEWSDDGGCETICGCWTEADGHCAHGNPSWLLALNLI